MDLKELAYKTGKGAVGVVAAAASAAIASKLGVDSHIVDGAIAMITGALFHGIANFFHQKTR